MHWQNQCLYYCAFVRNTRIEGLLYRVREDLTDTAIIHLYNTNVYKTSFSTQFIQNNIKVA